MRFKKQDQEMLAEAYKGIYSESHDDWPRNPHATVFEDRMFDKIYHLIVKMKGSTWDEVKQAISDQLDVRLDNMYGSPLEARIAKVYDRINDGALKRAGVDMDEIKSRMGH
jgi:hypothetical protein